MNISENLSNQFVTQSVQQKDDMYFYSQSWIWRAINALVSANDFNPSPTHISRRLNVDVEEVVCALEGLERLGFIYKNNNTYKKCINIVTNSHTNLDENSLLQTHISISSQILTNLNTNSLIKSLFINSNEVIIRKNLPKIIDFFTSLQKDSDDISSSEVFAIQISIGQLTNKPQGDLS